MYRIISINLLLILPVLAMASFSNANKKIMDNYIGSFKSIAISEMKRTGIPASIKLAQGMLESDLGRSDLAYKANNHFGLKCGKDWTGEIYFKLDDDTDSTGNLIESCFRAFSSAADSYSAHSEFLTNPAKQSRYGFLFELGSSDYVGWANGLKFSGYASDPTYADKLIRIIESNQLYKFDESVVLPRSPILKVNPNLVNIEEKETIKIEVRDQLKNGYKKVESESTTSDNYKADNKVQKYTIRKINDVKVVNTKGGESVSSLAKLTGVEKYEILEYNEGLSSPDYIFGENEIVFLDKKKRTFQDKEIPFHIVSKGENMYTISQKYGIRLESLLAKNNLSKDALPIQGEKISLNKHIPIDQTPRHSIVEKFDSFVDLGGLK
ncbi:MAG: glucosaminidase domain-containing protein [Saprospiraceae bacterium]|nr:glucosaminidase domain-containing protein [Saprospiraceae bacterium]